MTAEHAHRPRVARTAPAALIILLIAVALVVLPTSASLAEDTDEQSGQPRDAQELLALFDAPGIAADYVVVVDTSSSMLDGPNPPYLAAQAAVQAFADAVQPGDRVSMIYFDETTRPEPSRVMTSDEDRAALVQSVSGQSFQGTATDIGAALELAQREMTSVDANSVLSLLFVSDGANNPLPSSPYSADAQGAAWDALAAQGTALEDTHSLEATGIGIGTTAGVELLRRAFPGEVVSVVGVQPGELEDYFRDTVARTELLKIRSAVEQDLAREVSTSASLDRLSGQTGGELTLTNTREKLAITADPVAVSATTANGEALDVQLPEGVEPVTLAPGESVTLPLTVNAEAADDGIAWGSPSEYVAVAVATEVALSTPSADLLNRKYLNPPFAAEELERTETVSTSTEAQISVGVPWWMILLALALLALLVAVAVWLIRLWTIPPPLSGFLSYTAPDGSGRSIELRGKTMNLPSAEHPLPQARDSRARFFTKPGPGHRKRVYVRTRSGTVRVFAGFDPVGIDPTDGDSYLDIFDRVKIGDVELRYELVQSSATQASAQ